MFYLVLEQYVTITLALSENKFFLFTNILMEKIKRDFNYIENRMMAVRVAAWVWGWRD